MVLQRLTTISIILGVICIVLPLLLSYFGHVVIPQNAFHDFVTNSFKDQVKFVSNHFFDDQTSSNEVKKDLILSKDELSVFNGENGKPVYVAVLGKIYDVSSGRKHYGPGATYSVFAGKDATRAFVSGNFNDDGLRDDILDLGHDDFLGIQNWVEFYEKEYVYVGKVNGRYYNANGENEMELKKVWESMINAENWKNRNNEEKKIFPPCNSEWKSKLGARVWCTKLSGGINRNWSGVPRLYYKPGMEETRCVCVRNNGPPTGWNSESGHNDNGDLDHPNLRMYPGCPVTSESCSISDD